MSCKRGLFLSTILLVQLIYIYVDVVEAKCRPGLMMCDRRKGKREAGKVRPQQKVTLEAGFFQSELLMSLRHVLKVEYSF